MWSASFSLHQGLRTAVHRTCHVMVTFEPAVNFAAGVAVRKPLPQGDDLLGATALWHERFGSEKGHWKKCHAHGNWHDVDRVALSYNSDLSRVEIYCRLAGH